MANTAIIPTNNIQGDITSCRIETSRIKVDKDSAFSFTQISTYRSYDVCTKQVVDEYTVQQFTAFSFGLPVILIVFIVIIIAMLSDDRY